MSQEFIAHVKPCSNDKWETHLLAEHLIKVAELAYDFASIFHGKYLAKLAGLWHDLGKYRDAFQKYIRYQSGCDQEILFDKNEDHSHSIVGAVYAEKKLGDIGRILAYIIAGHHAGLANWFPTDTSSQAALSVRLKEAEKKNFFDEIWINNVPEDILAREILDLKSLAKPIGGYEGLHLWIRMLFSCLVDADFLDTERFMDINKHEQRKGWPNIKHLKNLFDKHMTNKVNIAPDSLMNRVRAEILQNCRDAAMLNNPIFSLTVPTGGGKTLASMAFALDHAVKYNKNHIIVVIPYTSIIEQTAEQYKKIFGDAVIEHHSNLSPNEEILKSRLSCENWDAPIIVTTNVQLFESLFAAKTGKCRKLHNLINSVIIIDEAQLLPPKFLQPVLDVLRLLTEHYRVTLLLSTATQPALSTIKDAFGKTQLRGLEQVREIIPDVKTLYQRLRRVKIERPKDIRQRLSMEEIANNLMQHERVLAIVNTRRDCRELFNLMPKGTICLSGLMCGQHRSDVIENIKQKLETGEPARVISTQLVEAGVDLDFPVVYRALTGLDSIAQAAGRCNREGKLGTLGKVVVFVPPRPSPKGQLLFAEQATRSVWHNYSGEPIEYELFEDYFRQYFWKEELDKYDIISLLTKDARSLCLQFRKAAEKFNIIDDRNTRQILVPYKEEVREWIDELRHNGPERYLMRQLQRYHVTVYEKDCKSLGAIGAIEELYPGIWTTCVTNAYDDEKGLVMADDLYSCDATSLLI